MCCYVFVLSRCIIYRLYTGKTFASCCCCVQWNRTGIHFVEVLMIFSSSKTISQITTSLFMKD